MKIILIANSGLGDAILTFPLLKAIKKKSSDAEITVIASSASQPAFDLLGLHQHNFLFNPQGGIKSLFQVLSLARKLKKLKADYAFVSIAAMNNTCALLASLSGAKNVVGHFNPEVKFTKRYNTPVQLIGKRHDLLSNYELITAFGEEIDTEAFEQEKINYQTLKEKFKPVKNNGLTVGIHPGSGMQDWKRWNKKNFAHLINLLVERYKVNIFYGPNEKELEGIAANENIKNHKNLLLNEVSEKIAACQLFVSNDSGLMNLAVALGVKTIGIFGPTNHNWTRPFGEENILIKTELPCQPCYQKRGQTFNCTNEISKKCLKDISVEQVYDICLKAIKNSSENNL